MATRDELPPEEREVPPPSYLVPAVRCAMEMLLVGLVVALIGLPATNALSLGVMMIATFTSMIVVLFWCLNRHMAEWVRRAQGRPTMADGDTGPL